MAKRRSRFTPTQMIVHLFGWTPLLITLIQVMTGNMTANPIQAVEQRFGRVAIYFLIASLTCTPIVTLTGWREPIKRRRALGLYAFMYASLHFFVFVGIDYGFDLKQVAQLISEKPFILLGLTAGTILLALAITSFTWWMRQMGKGWQSLHRTIYLGGLIVVLHYAMARKANIATLSGDIIQPLIIGILLVTLLLLRVPAIRKQAASLRQRVNARRILHSQ
jgi:methionine sulfoxide reductase heme-binding subunit